jgi:ubiquinone/menaquinone biosynthesis C-methylase UbiE
MGGYDDCYQAVPCFWGTEPGSLVARYLHEHRSSIAGCIALDLGCGEGKNAAALTRAGCIVDAIDCSRFAIANGKNTFRDLPVRWAEADAQSINLGEQKYDVVIAYGVLHCLTGLSEIQLLIERAKRATKRGGYHLVCSFNNRSHNLSAHPGFYPTLASHDWYCSQYSEWSLEFATDSDLIETHPHNNISHHHSMSRLVARRPL